MVAPHQLYHMSHTLFLALCTAFADEIFVGLSLARYALNSLSCTDFDLLLALSYPYLVFSIHMHAQFFFVHLIAFFLSLCSCILLLIELFCAFWTVTTLSVCIIPVFSWLLPFVSCFCLHHFMVNVHDVMSYATCGVLILHFRSPLCYNLHISSRNFGLGVDDSPCDLWMTRTAPFKKT